MESCLGSFSHGLLTMPITVNLPLDLPDIRVFASQILKEVILLIEVESTLCTVQCYRCGQEIDRIAVRTVRGDRPAPSAAPGTNLPGGRT